MNLSLANVFTHDFIFLKIGKKIIGVEYPKIQYIEGLKEYTLIITHSGRHIVNKRMKELEKSLPENFIRVHNSFIINIFSISKIEDNQIFIAEKKIPISQKYKEVFLDQIHKRML